MKIQILKPGLLVRDELGYILDARSTVTLIQTSKYNIIIDTGVPEDREMILANLSRYGLKPTAIAILINTHLHSDHCGNNSLFKAAKFLANAREAGFDENTSTAVNEGYIVDEGVSIIETPGHTLGSISVVVNTAENLTYVLAGDALPIQDNYLKWVPPGINFNPQIAIDSMRKIVEIADVVIPGHDRPFEPRK